MTRAQQLTLLLGCALVAWLEAPRAWHVLEGDLERAALLHARSEIMPGSPPLAAREEGRDPASAPQAAGAALEPLAAMVLASAALRAGPVPSVLPAPASAAPAGAASR